MQILNLQTSPNNTHYVRAEEHDNGDVALTLVHKKADNSFEFLTTLVIPKLQRANLAAFLTSYANH